MKNPKESLVINKDLLKAWIDYNAEDKKNLVDLAIKDKL